MAATNKLKLFGENIAADHIWSDSNWAAHDNRKYGFTNGDAAMAEDVNTAIKTNSLVAVALAGVVAENMSSGEIGLTTALATMQTCIKDAFDNAITFTKTTDTTNGDALKVTVFGHTAKQINVTNAKSSSVCTGNSATATKLLTARNINVSDADGSHNGTAASFNGTAAITIKLPETIKATIEGNASSATNVTTNINGKAITTIFEENGTTVKNATNATYDSQGKNIGSTYVVSSTISCTNATITFYTAANVAKSITVNNVANATNATNASKVAVSSATASTKTYLAGVTASSGNVSVYTFTNAYIQNRTLFFENNSAGETKVELGKASTAEYATINLYSTSTSTPAIVIATEADQTNKKPVIKLHNGSTYNIILDSYSGTVSAAYFSATSDRRLKENLKTFEAEKSILDLPIYKFDFIKGRKNNVGCMAQDLQEICPEIVDKNEDGYLSIQESKIVYLLLQEVKKLKQEVEDLKKGK